MPRGRFEIVLPAPVRSERQVCSRGVHVGEPAVSSLSPLIPSIVHDGANAASRPACAEAVD